VTTVRSFLEGTLSAKNRPIFLAVVFWWFVFKPKQFLYIYLKVIKKIRQFFSISLLFRTLFAPWKRDEINMGNLSLQDRLRVLVMNLISRLVGAIVRGGTIVVGIISIISTTIGFTFAILAFVLLPILSLLLLMTAFSGGIS
jgi:hypothetical protein